MNNYCHNFQEHKVTSSDFVHITVQNPKTLQFTVINDEEEQKILTSKKLEPLNVLAFLLKNTR